MPVVKRAGKGQKAVVMRLDKGLGKMGKEAYRLRVAPNGVRIEGATAAGLFYGVQTLLQLLPARCVRQGCGKRIGACRAWRWRMRRGSGGGDSCWMWRGSFIRWTM